jgi:NAD(P)-dependent dehydrogenase (short-subunit alcohol dehydrogenase family)
MAHTLYECLGCCKVEEGAPPGATGRSHVGVLAPLNTPEQLATFDQEFMAICERHTDHSVGDSEVIDQANAILFLANDESRCITGQSLVVDRGMCL